MKDTLPKDHPWHSDNVTQEKLQAVYDAAYAKIEELFEQDEDGDYPVSVDVVDRSRYVRRYWALEPHHHKIDTEEEEMRALSDLSGNARSATEALNSFIQSMQYERRGRNNREKALKELEKVLVGTPMADFEDGFVTLYLLAKPIAEKYEIGYASTLLEQACERLDKKLIKSIQLAQKRAKEKGVT